MLQEQTGSCCEDYGSTEMKLCDILESRDYTKDQVKHPELKLLNFMDKKDWGKKTNTKTTDVIVRNKKTGDIFGRRAIVQREM